MMTTAFVALATIAALAAPSHTVPRVTTFVVHDEPQPESRQAHVDAALVAYESEDYLASARHFEAAYAVEQRAEDLFNAGRVYELAGDHDAARSYYERFLDQPEVPEDQRAQTQQRLDALNEAHPERVAAVPPPHVVANGASPESDYAPPGRRRAKRRRLHWTTSVGAGLMPVGVATIGGGVAMAVTAMKNSKNAKKSATGDTPVADTPQQQLAERQARIADGLMIAGGVVAAAGLVFILSGVERRRRIRADGDRPRRWRADARGVSLSF